MYKKLSLEEFKKYSNIYYNKKTGMEEPLEKHIDTQIKMINTVFEKPRREFVDLYYSTVIALTGTRFKGLHDFTIKNTEQLNTALKDILQYSAVFHDIGKAFGVWDDGVVDNSQIIPGVHHYLSYSVMKIISKSIIIPESVIQLSEKLPTDPEEIEKNFIKTIMFITLMHHEYFIKIGVRNEFNHLFRKKILFNGSLLRHHIDKTRCREYCGKKRVIKWLYNSIFNIDKITPQNMEDYTVNQTFIGRTKRLIEEGKDKTFNQPIELFTSITNYREGDNPIINTNILKELKTVKILNENFYEALKMRILMTSKIHYSKLLYAFTMFDNHSASLNREGKPADNNLLKTLIKFEEYSVIDEIIKNTLVRKK